MTSIELLPQARIYDREKTIKAKGTDCSVIILQSVPFYVSFLVKSGSCSKMV